MTSENLNNEAASADLIARQVAGWTKERDRLQDLINAASASQSSTSGAAKGGVTSIGDDDHFRSLLSGMHQLSALAVIRYVDENYLAHVARQESASSARAVFESAFRAINDYLPRWDEAAGEYENLHERQAWERWQKRIAADTGAVDAVKLDATILQRLVNEYTHACEMVQGHAVPQWRNIVGFFEHACAQQREAGRREQMQMPKGFRELLTDQANEIARLQAVLVRQPVSEGLTESQIDAAMRAHMESARTGLNLRGCIEHSLRALAAVPPAKATQQPELTVWCEAMPESNGKSNFTAVLMRKDQMWDGPHVTIERSEYPDRIRYEADRVRYLIGELADEPDILAYDADKHSGYVPPAKAEGLTTTCFACDGTGKRERHATGAYYRCGQCNGSGQMSVILAQQATKGGAA